MKLKCVICDIDGTLLPPDQGFCISKEVEAALIELQRQGMCLILASARIFQGVMPIAKQVHMEKYGGYILSSNGAYAYDVKNKCKLFCHGIQQKDAQNMWSLFQEKGLDFAIAQPNGMVASGYSKGFELDHYNCDVDYCITHHPQKLVKEEISKCSASGTPEEIDRCFDELKHLVERDYPYQVVRSTPYFVDIIQKECGKARGLAELFRMVDLSFSQAAAIGDGDSDAEMLHLSALGATLENGSAKCYEAADMMVPSCTQNGCLIFFDKLKKML